MIKYLVDNKFENERIDSYLIKVLNISRSKIQKLIKTKKILVNNVIVKNSYSLKKDDVIYVLDIEDEEFEIGPEIMDLNIVYEDDDIIIVNKDNGVVVHPAFGNKSGTLVNGLLHQFKDLSDINGEFRPGIVHRIDSFTTGLIVVAKNNEAHEELAKQLRNKMMTRKYYALVWGVINNDTGTIDAPIGRDINNRKKQAVTSVNSKSAVTHFKVIKRFDEVTLIEASLETGRTHQIRVHFEYIKHPIVNDQVYGRKKTIDDTGQCLHAKTLGFKHPRTKKYIEFDSELPSCFINIMETFIIKTDK
ncbi:MAG: RluA family pseudouridine synthase [Bacilli bacterium]|nr:RluA family pseudouridine synthase [Bacilli bacterium]MDD4282635.1 RluA family pseudouridine synthase [Bacilli bacterium]MDD4719072.1 RluA family pseudouridine synthase [Bacilli bacterium]